MSVPVRDAESRLDKETIAVNRRPSNGEEASRENNCYIRDLQNAKSSRNFVQG